MSKIFRFTTPELSTLRRRAEAAGRLLHAALLQRVARQSATKAANCGNDLTRGHEAFKQFCAVKVSGLPLLADRRLAELRNWMAKVAAALVIPEPSAAFQTPQMIAQDIVALTTEFSAVRVTTRFISVETEDIKLEGVSFGPFEVRYWFDPNKKYEVIALEPNCCARDHDYTHPHVSGNELCAGDGKFAIAAARADGRLFDCLITIRNVLNTYSADTAYCSLDKWYDNEDEEENTSVTCDDCGDTYDDSETNTCERCGNRLCSDCTVTCAVCDDPFCGTHSNTCRSCGRSTCRNHSNGCECGKTVCDDCIKDCVDCGDTRCEYCLDDDNRCPNCVEKAEQESEEDDAEQDEPAII